jgi:hypothetical protein
MGTIFTYNSYENRSVDIPAGSPLFKHIKDEEKHIKDDENKEIYSFTKPTNPTNYEILIKELQNSKKNKYSSSEYTASLCCKERDGYGSDFNRQNI